MAYQKVDHPPKGCAECGEIFKPNTSHQNFCTKKCYRKFGKKHYGHSEGDKETRKRYSRIHVRNNKRPYRKHVELCCSRCEFVPEHPCQLDVDHIDGNHSNNEPGNLQTLCANCHRLKTAKQLNWYV